jgi:hypothetical protein
MNSGMKLFSLALVLALAMTFGCARKQQQVPAYQGGIAPTGQPQINASAPSSSGTRSSSYIK